MAFCISCGTQLAEGAKYCQKCGVQVRRGSTPTNSRQQEYVGKVYKCLQCGEVLKSFEINCPACGHELRGVKASTAVKEFALKLEAIESRREYEQPRGIFARAEALQRVSKTDEQKISLIKSFAVPNSKEDILEFMILATSSINLNAYDTTNGASKSDQELNAAWLSKVQQVYEKAKRSYASDNIFGEIKHLHDKCYDGIKKKKKSVIAKYVLMLGGPWILILIMCVLLIPMSQKEETEELERLDNIVLDVRDALENEEFSHALRIADSIDYQRYDVEMERKWDLEKEYWIEKVLTEAAAHGIDLEYTPSTDIDKANDDLEDASEKDTINSGFIQGFMDGLKSSMDDGEN